MVREKDRGIHSLPAWLPETVEIACYEKALAKLQDLARHLEVQYLGAATSLREDLEETLTVVRLQLPDTLRQTLRSTNPLKSAFDKVRAVRRQVKRWRNGEQVLR